MQDSMMIADVGDMEKVSGSRITATPLAPPRPGNTDVDVSRIMPIHISMMLNGCRTVAKP